MKKQINYKQTEVGEIPEDWQILKLGEIANVIGGAPFKSKDFTSNGFPVLKIANVKPMKLLFENLDYISSETAKSYKNAKLNKGDLLITMTGNRYGGGPDSWVGKVALFNQDDDYYLNQRVGILRCRNNEEGDIKFLAYYLGSVDMQRKFVMMATGAGGQANISPTQIKTLNIPLPKLEEQHQIASVLSSLDDKIELNRRMNKTLEEIGKALFKRWFVDFEFPFDFAQGKPNLNGKPYKSSGGEMVESELGMIPKGWEVKSLDQIAEYLNGLACQKYPPLNELDVIPVIKIAELRNGFTSNSDEASSLVDKKYHIASGDVLFSWSGSLEVCLWSHGKGVLNQHLFKVSSEIYPKWFYYHWTLRHLPEFRIIATSKATTMGHIQRKHLSDALVVVPTKEVFDALSATMIELMDRVIVNNGEIANLIAIRDSLLPRLMSGRLRV